MTHNPKRQMSRFELWASACNITGTELCVLETKSDASETGLFETKKPFIGCDWNEYYESPVYHVWINGGPVASTGCYQDALACYRREIQERYGPRRDIPKVDGSVARYYQQQLHAEPAAREAHDSRGTVRSCERSSDETEEVLDYGAT